MKFFSVPQVLLTLLVMIVMTIESVFSFPCISLMIWLTQLPMLADEDMFFSFMAIGICLAVLYHLPFALGIAIIGSLTFLGRSTVWKDHLQTRNGLLILVSILVLLGILQKTMSSYQWVVLGLHFGLVIVVSRVIALRRLRHR